MCIFIRHNNNCMAARRCNKRIMLFERSSQLHFMHSVAQWTHTHYNNTVPVRCCKVVKDSFAMTFKLKPRIALYSLPCCGRSIDHDNEMIQVNGHGLTFAVLLVKPRIDWIASYYFASRVCVWICALDKGALFLSVSELVVGSRSVQTHTTVCLEWSIPCCVSLRSCFDTCLEPI